MINVKQLESREEWLEVREKSLGGSDAASVLGLSPWKSNVKLWLEKKGELEIEDISDKSYVKFGIEAEKPIRDLFTLDHDEFEVQYFENNIWINDKFPFAHASLDGWITEIATGAKGILEIKTVNIYNNNDLAWKDRIPDYYYTQILHYMMITEFDFAILKARIKYAEDYIAVKTYRIDRLNVLEDIKLLAEREKDFYKSLQGDVVPNLILPNI